MTKLYLMLGYPGAGKTTAAKIIHELTGAVHISSDILRVKMFPHPDFSQTEHNHLYRVLDERVTEALNAGQDAIYDANLNRHRHRIEKYQICEATGAEPVLLWVQTPKELAKTRAVDHSRGHLVPKEEAPHDMFERIARVIEEPKADEPYIVLDGTKITHDYVKEQLGL